jgi:hypothetical protein
VPLLTLWPPPRIDGSVPVTDVPPSSVEDPAAQSSHTQHERLLPTPTSRAVTALRPIKKEIPAAAMLPIKIERRRARLSDENLENGSHILSRRFRREDLFLKPPGIVVTVPGTRAR